MVRRTSRSSDSRAKTGSRDVDGERDRRRRRPFGRDGGRVWYQTWSEERPEMITVRDGIPGRRQILRTRGGLTESKVRPDTKDETCVLTQIFEDTLVT